MINFKFRQNCWLESGVLISCKSFVTFDFDLKCLDKIFRLFSEK